jgi:Tol biopolymer transport system component
MRATIGTVARLALLGALAAACNPDNRPVGPVAKVTVDGVADDQLAYGPWSAPVNIGPAINTAFNDADPAISKDGLSLYISTDRPGGLGGLDIWVSQRASLEDPWGPPQPLGPNVNSEADDLAPAFSPDGHWMYFGSSRPGGCGGADIYVSHRHDAKDDFGWEPAVNLGCVVNTASDELFPTIFEDEARGGTTLYYASNRPGGLGDFDIYASRRSGEDGAFGPGAPVAELNSSGRDTRTAIRRDGLEIFLASDRPGGLGDRDLYVATRASTLEAWPTPVNLGPVVNSAARDGAPALSFNGTTLYFFSRRPGGFGASDLYVTTRQRIDR